MLSSSPSGDWLLTLGGGGARKHATGKQAEGSSLAIVLGSILDGIAESFVLGLMVLQGGVSLSLLAGVVLSNLPEGMSSSAGLKAAGWPTPGWCCHAAQPSQDARRNSLASAMAWPSPSPRTPCSPTGRRSR